MASLRQRLAVNLRYLRALLRRFRTTFVLASAVLVLGPVLFQWHYRGADGKRLGFGEALHHVYFLLYGQPNLPYVDDWMVELLNLVIPPLGLALLADGVVRFGYLFFARHRSDKEWIEVIAESLKGHVVVCGAGRVGYRVTSQLRAMGLEVIVIEKAEDAAFVSVLRDEQVPVLIDDTRSPQCLPRTNMKDASAIVCATDDDLANLNIALDARRLKPDIRVVIRLFDEDLVSKVRDTFKAEALSSSSLAAPAMALAALDPRIVHSFRIGEHLMVVSVFEAAEGLPGLTLSEVRDRFGALVLSLSRGAAEQLHPPGEQVIQRGDALTLQATYKDYRMLRAFTGDTKPPVWIERELAPLPRAVD